MTGEAAISAARCLFMFFASLFRLRSVSAFVKTTPLIPSVQVMLYRNRLATAVKPKETVIRVAGNRLYFGRFS
jgi:hypothetical protein